MTDKISLQMARNVILAAQGLDPSSTLRSEKEIVHLQDFTTERNYQESGKYFVVKSRKGFSNAASDWETKRKERLA